MNNNSHTPGPWNTFTKMPGVYAESGREIVFHAHLSRSADESERLANARLIAAAPELLEALEELVSRRESACAERGEMDRLAGSDGRYNRARAAIAKAKGLS